MESTGYYKCMDCGQVLDRQKFPEDQPCPYCNEAAYENDKTYRGSRARALPGVTPEVIAAGAKRREHLEKVKSSWRLSHYFWAGLALLTLGVLLPIATPMFYRQILEVELARTGYLVKHAHVLNALSSQLIAEGDLWPQASSAIAGAAPGGILNYARERLTGGAAFCRWATIITGLLGGAGVAMLYLRAIQWPEFRSRAHLLCLAILLGVIGLNYTGARYLAHARSTDYISNLNEIDAMLGMLVYAELREKDSAEALQHLANGAPRDFVDGRGATYLHVAAENGASDVIEPLLRWGLDVNGADSEGMTPLHYAAARGQSFAAETLMSQGADIHTEDHRGRTILHFASTRKSNAILKDLLDRGLQINVKDHEGHTPLVVAAESGNAEAIELLLRFGANLEDRDAEGNTLLQMTLLNVLERMYRDSASLAEDESPQLDIFETLLSFGADVNVEDSVAQSPLHWVRDARNRVGDDPERQAFLDGLVELLINNGADYTATDLAGKPAYTLHDAASIGHVAVARKLLESTPESIHDVDVFRRTPFQVAVQQDRREVAVLLLESGADPDRWFIEGETPLGVAVQRGNVEMVRILLDHGAQVLVDGPGREGPLLRAARNGSPEIVELLLNHGCLVNEQNPQGNSPLHLAAEAGHEDIVRMLLERGADTAAWNRAGKTPLDVAEASERKHVASLLRRLPSQVSPAANLAR